MGDRSAIEWTDATWNPTVGCSVVSPGCTNCYAMRLAARLERMGQPRYAGLTMPAKAGPVWTGEVRSAPDDTLFQPMRWKRPRRIFVNSMSDLFHPQVTIEQVTRIWSVMKRTPQHTYQILTKRPDRMFAYLDDFADSTWAGPLPNVWLGTSAEDQARFDERGPAMAAIAELGWRTTWCSAEPLLGPLDITAGASWLRWLVVGGESGPGARPMHPDWARSLRDQCAASGVSFFFKQWGEWADAGSAWGASSGSAYDLAGCRFVEPSGLVLKERELATSKAAAMRAEGKKAAGNTLDGRQWQEHPTGLVTAEIAA